MRSLLITILLGIMFIGCTENQSAPQKKEERLLPSVVEAPLAVSGNEIDKVSKNNYILIFDDSGSMSDYDSSGKVKFNSAKEAVKIFLNSLKEEDNIHFVTLNQGVLNGLNNVKLGLDKLSNRGGTPLREALIHSLKYFDQLITENKGYGSYTIISITDGEADQDPTMIVKEILNYKKADIAIKTIGFNMPANNPLNSKMVDYYSATDFESLKRVLLSIKAESENFTDNTTQFK